MPDIVVSRVRWKPTARNRRSPVEWLILWFPWLYRWLAALVFARLRPGSRVRAVLLQRAAAAGWASVTRRDVKVNRCFFARDVEFEFPDGMKTLGLDDAFTGHEGRFEALDRLAEVWGMSDMEPVYVLDLGDRIVVLGEWRATAQASGVHLDQELGQLVTVRDGLVFHDQTFMSWDDAARAAGLEPGVVDLPERRKGRSSERPFR